MLTKLRKIVVGLVREHVIKVAKRSAEWPTVRLRHLQKNPSCAACGGTSLVQVHHKEPFHLRPELELDPKNLITLCIKNLCHIEVGHSDDYKAYNPNVEIDARAILKTPEDRARIVAQAKVSKLYAEPPPIPTRP